MEQRFEPLARGLWGVLVTPFRGERHEVDTESLARLAGHYRRAGASGLVALGIMGEAARLDSSERRLVLETVVAAAGNMPVVAGMGWTASAPAIEEARVAAAAGARAVMVQVPTSDPRLVAGHLQRISVACGLGIVVQDYPVATGVTIAPHVLAEATRQAGVVVGFKLEAVPTAPAVAALTALIDLPVFGGLGGIGLLDELLAGSAGAFTGFSVPEALVAALDAWQHDGGYVAARARLLPWLPLMLCEGQDKVNVAVRKEILRRRGLIAEASVRPPGLSLPAVLHAALDAHLSAMPLPHA
jgi:4-hydroxy-tetrahydrodipicolinate synthase